MVKFKKKTEEFPTPYTCMNAIRKGVLKQSFP